MITNPCQTSEAEITELCRIYDIPHHVILWLSTPNEHPGGLLLGEIALHSLYFWADLSLSLHPFLPWILAQLYLALGQLHPTASSNLISIYILWHERFLGFPSLKVIQNLIHMKHNPSLNRLPSSHVYATVWVRKFIKGNLSSNKIWRDHWLLEGGNWEFPVWNNRTNLGHIP